MTNYLSNKKLAINASNIHYGGAFQVAVSFIQEYSLSSAVYKNVTLIISTEIRKVLLDMGLSLEKFENVITLDAYLNVSSLSRLRKVLNKYDVVFTVFGPYYGPKINGTHLQGFGQAWILRKNEALLGKKNYIKQYSQSLKFAVQKYFFLKADALIVESMRTQTLMRADKSFCKSNVHVVANAISSGYLDPAIDGNRPPNSSAKTLTIGILSRDYPHKNLDYLVSLKERLKKEADIDAVIVVTLSENEWANKSLDFKQNVNNVGPISLSNGPQFYKQLDFVCFPSLLETFSATPIEALAMKKPLFASDRDFVRDFCGEYAFYIDPLNPQDGATKLVSYVNSTMYTEGEDSRLQEAREYVKKCYSPVRRMHAYFGLINRYVS